MSYSFAGRVAVLTGAASGIGAALAAEFAARGCRLALIDRDEAGLARTVATLGGATVSLHVVDLLDRDAIAALPEAVVAEHGKVDILVNNAGIAAMGRFDQTSLDEFDTVMSINFGAVVAMTKAFLPYLSRDGRIANLSSIFGVIAPPAQIPYAASKFAVRGFTEALRHELAGTGVKVTCVHPGGINTSIAKNAVVASGIGSGESSAAKGAFQKLLRYPPKRAARRVADAIGAGRPRLLIGADAIAVDLLARFLPGRYGSVMRVGMGGLAKHIGEPVVGNALR